jgi:hypothetical protein
MSIERYWRDRPVTTAIVVNLLTAAVWDFGRKVLAPVVEAISAVAWVGFGEWLHDLGWLAFLLAVVNWLMFGRGRPTHPPKIRLMDVSVRSQAGVSYPLKCVVQMRNESRQSVVVQLSWYVPGFVTLKKFLPAVLQVKLQDEWCPSTKGTDRVAVMPGQYFQAWIGVDDAVFSEEQVQSLIGRIGTLTLTVDGSDVLLRL